MRYDNAYQDAKQFAEWSNHPLHLDRGQCLKVMVNGAIYRTGYLHRSTLRPIGESMVLERFARAVAEHIMRNPGSGFTYNESAAEYVLPAE